MGEVAIALHTSSPRVSCMHLGNFIPGQLAVAYRTAPKLGEDTCDPNTIRMAEEAVLPFATHTKSGTSAMRLFYPKGELFSP